MTAGTGKHTNNVLKFLEIEGDATLISNEVDYKFVMQKVIDHNIGIRNLVRKKFKQVDFNGESITAIQF